MSMTKTDDPIIAEVRQNRQRIFFDECGGDWVRLFDRLRASENEMKDRLVTSVEGQQANRQVNADAG
jgi:hypothetical protein